MRCPNRRFRLLSSRRFAALTAEVIAELVLPSMVLSAVHLFHNLYLDLALLVPVAHRGAGTPAPLGAVLEDMLVGHRPGRIDGKDMQTVLLRRLRRSLLLLLWRWSLPCR